MMNEKYKKAKELADKIDNHIIEIFKNGCNFKVEAGAGSGKTYSLMKVLSFIKENYTTDYLKKGQKIACITYTNAAVNVIKERLEDESFIVPCTIHSFAWDVIKKYQKEIINFTIENNMLSKDFDKEKDTIKKVVYDLGVKYYDDGTLHLFHDDVIKLFSHMLDFNKFRIMFASQYPIIFIDEYQDSNKDITTKFIKYFINEKTTPSIQFGFFGDSWQTIYKNNNAIGTIDNDNIININKVVNFRSCPEIIQCLNKIRPDLKQESPFEEGDGIAKVVHCNDYNGARRNDRNFIGDLPVEEIRKRLNNIIKTFDDGSHLKVLMLTHKILASQQDYSNIYESFGSGFKDGDDKLINYIANVLEPIINSLSKNDVKGLYDALGASRPPITSQKHKLMWKKLNDKIQANKDSTLLEILEIIYESKIVPMPDDVVNIYENMINNPEDNYNDKVSYEHIANIKYLEFERAVSFLKPDSFFSTDHGVKGEEYDDVIFVIGKGWNLYDFESVLVMDETTRNQKLDTYERNRNLFYVGCSRPRKKLILLITCELNDDFYNYLADIFGKTNIVAYNEYIST